MGARKERGQAWGRRGSKVGAHGEGDGRPGGVSEVEHGESKDRDRGALGHGELLGSRTFEKHRVLDVD